MNLRRGLIRLWLLGSVCWVLLVGVVQYGDVRQEFAKAASEHVYEVTTDDGRST